MKKLDLENYNSASSVSLEPLARKILEKIKRLPSEPTAYEDLFAYCRQLEEADKTLSHQINAGLRDLVARRLAARINTERFYELWKKTLLFDAPLDLDSYLIYLELMREPEKRFYMPRRKVLKQVVDALQDLADDNLDELFLSMPPRIGKLLADDTPILTTEGWKNHGDLKVGDMVFAPSGKAVPVLAVFPKHHTTHRVTFTDGSYIDCHYNHEWRVYNRYTQRVQTLETKQMIGRVDNSEEIKSGRGHRYFFNLENHAPIHGSKKELFVKPYTLGAWLGDGTNTNPYITGVDEEIFQAIEEDGYMGKRTFVHATTAVTTIAYEGLRKALNKYGFCHPKERVEKFIPEDYLVSPISVRLELLAGLIDTDGCARPKEHRYDFVTSEEKLKDTFIQLIHTFGWRTCCLRKEPTTSSSGIVGKKPYWVISFNPTRYIPCRVPRKRIYEFSKQRRVSIASIEETEPKPGNCITVEGGMYLAGHNMIPTHNSSLMIFFMTWLMGRNTEAPNLYSSYTDIITKSFYNGVLEILQDVNTYAWHDVFPGVDIARTNAADEIIDMGRKKHYPTLTCRSIDGTINGACDAQDGVIISDDLVSGIEEALSKDRLISKWGKVDNNLIPRGKGKTKYLWIGTRWSLLDPTGIRMDVLQNDPKYAGYRWKVINLPALNENDESNFDYPYGVGFDTLYYQRRRASFERNNDLASWNAQYMGEPIERDGALFTPDDFKYYNGELPQTVPDRIFMAIDPSFGGGDFCAGPVCIQYGDDIYVPDALYDNGDKMVTQPLIAALIEKHGVRTLQVEANKATQPYVDGISAELKKRNVHCTVTTKPAPTTKSKDQRIFDRAPDIREHFIFLETGKRSKPYDLFMQNVFSFKAFAKNKHDDAPDSLSMAADMAFRPAQTIKFFKRTF